MSFCLQSHCCMLLLVTTKKMCNKQKNTKLEHYLTGRSGHQKKNVSVLNTRVAEVVCSDPAQKWLEMARNVVAHMKRSAHVALVT
uniref:Uncharacterized protein n=1 Tax=Electrophorus electricus TaxID=8005 RepID=A0AAY5E8C2_ELEEL